MRDAMKRQTFAFVVALALAHGQTQARDQPLPEEGTPVTVNRVLDDGDALVVQLVIVARPGSFLRVISDKPNQGGVGAAIPDRAEGTLPEARLTIFGDHIDRKAGMVR